MQMLGCWTFYLQISKDLPLGSQIFDLSFARLRGNNLEYFLVKDKSNQLSDSVFFVDKHRGTLHYMPNEFLLSTAIEQNFSFSIHIQHDHFYYDLPFEISFTESKTQFQRETSTKHWLQHFVTMFYHLPNHRINHLFSRSCPNNFLPKSICSCTVSNSTNFLSYQNIFVKQYFMDCNISNIVFPIQELDTEVQVIQSTRRLRHRRNNNQHLYFKQSRYTFHILENSPSNTRVGEIQAYQDDNVAENLNYGLEPMENIHSLKKFRIDQSGVIYTKVSLDRELFARHQFRVTASRFNANQARTILSIIVDDENDNQPVFAQPDGYKLLIEENLPLQSLVFQINAYDADEGNNGQVEYSISKFVPSSGNRVFDILSGGDLVVKGNVDREEQSQYNLTIKAQDNGNPSRFSTLHITINVEDQNDNWPQFTKSKYIVRVNENIAVGSRIGTVSASDTDAGKNGEVTYSLILGDRMNKFRLDSKTGDLYTERILDYEEAYTSSRAKYTLTIRASDGGQPPHSNSSGIMEVYVVDMNDNSPQFHNSPYHFEVQENAKINSVVGQVEASDQDHGENARISYSIVPQSSKTDHRMFRIDQSSGVVRVAKQLDYEITKEYHFTVRASDNGQSRRFVRAEVYVKILDVNDNAPQFMKKQYRVRIAEDTNIGVDIIVVNASDPDKLLTGGINYQIVGGNAAKKFSIVTRNNAGIVKLNKHLDYNDQQLYLLRVKASDGSLTNTTTVSIFITDTNSHRPAFDQAEYSVSLKEDVGIGTVVLKVHASDEDVGENARITYCFPNYVK